MTLALIRCTQPKPCGHCWYCLAWARRMKRRPVNVRYAARAIWFYFHAYRKAHER